MKDTDHTTINVNISHIRNIHTKPFRIKHFVPKIGEIIKLPLLLQKKDLARLAIFLDFLYEYDDSASNKIIEYGNFTLTERQFKYVEKLNNTQFITFKVAQDDQFGYNHSTIDLKYENLILK